MFALQNLGRRAPQLAKLQHRTVVSTPPRVRMPFAEKVMFGVALYVGIMAVPLYISVNMKYYTNREAIYLN